MVMGRLWGWKGSLPPALALAEHEAAARAAAPELMWTTVPPAKSSAPWPRIQPPPQTQWQTGK